MAYQNRPEEFRELKIEQLIRCANGWARRYPNVINRICLYGYSPPNYGNTVLASLSTKYAVIFEVDDLDPKDKILEKLELDTGLYATTKNKQTFRNLMGNCFECVYALSSRKELPKQWLFEWNFRLKRPDDKLPEAITIDGPKWVIYDKYSKRDNIVMLWINYIRKLSIY